MHTKKAESKGNANQKLSRGVSTIVASDYCASYYWVKKPKYLFIPVMEFTVLPSIQLQRPVYL